MTLKKIVLIRHGETEFTTQHRFCGSADPGLTDKGAEDARALLDNPAVAGLDVLLCSPARRTLQTASPIAESFDLLRDLDEGFRETNFGAWEGVKFSEVSDSEAHRLWTKNPAFWAPPEGEAGICVQARAVKALTPALEDFGKIGIVTHKGTIRLLYSFFMGLPASRYRALPDVAPASITELWLNDGEVVRAVLGDVSHLLPPVEESSGEYSLSFGREGDKAHLSAKNILR